jgi:peptidoglycan/xylan/chitin deacetylase (PgdA/CDA1 family)
VPEKQEKEMLLLPLVIATGVVLCFKTSWLPFLVAFLLTVLILAPPRGLLGYISAESGVVFDFRNRSSLDANGTKTVYLTIDDSPTSEGTPLILEALKDCGDSKALFFVIGEYAEKAPDVLCDIVRAGHLIGNHDERDRLTAAFWRGTEEIRDGLQKSHSTIDRLLKEEGLPKSNIDWMRPGGGLVNRACLSAANDLGYNILVGDVYGHDCITRFVPSLLKWFCGWRVKDGSVVILHDGSFERAQSTASIIRYLYHERNVRFASVKKTR